MTLRSFPKTAPIREDVREAFDRLTHHQRLCRCGHVSADHCASPIRYGRGPAGRPCDASGCSCSAFEASS